ncbi:MAG: hypothetical protein AB1733_21310 [Thermodesulfobacteriota bacterium]
MNISRMNLKSLMVCAAFVIIASAVHGEELYAPDLLWDRNIAEKTDPIDIADTHLGIPYRDDGALDNRGNFTTFAQPETLFDTPGLNCSGLVVSVSRFLFNKNWDLRAVSRDQQGNSGDNSRLGKDWDFGWDLILNLTAGTKRRLLMPDGGNHPVEEVDGLTVRGFDLHDQRAWNAVLSQMRVGHIYLGSISKPANRPGYKVLHYHVVLMIPDGKGGVWLYHSTRRSNVHKMNIAAPAGFNRFMSQFRERNGAKHILVAEAEIPDLRALAQSDAENTDLGARTAAPAASESPGSKPVLEGQPPASAPSAQQVAETETDSKSPAPPPQIQPPKPELVIEHRAGKVYQQQPNLTTHVPRFGDKEARTIEFWFRNMSESPRNLEIVLKAPTGQTRYRGGIANSMKDLSVIFPRDFENGSTMAVQKGQYSAEVLIDGSRWLVNLFEVTVPKEAAPKIVEVKAPKTVKSGQTFAVKVVARNNGAESDYGGITVSTPASSGLQLVSANPGKIYPPGSTVLSVTTDRIRTRVPMAERWINLWAENQSYDMELRVKATKPGTHPLYVRCALRGVNVKSSVVLMDPANSSTADQQGFPVYVHTITVE